MRGSWSGEFVKRAVDDLGDLGLGHAQEIFIGSRSLGERSHRVTIAHPAPGSPASRVESSEGVSATVLSEGSTPLRAVAGAPSLARQLLTRLPTLHPRQLTQRHLRPRPAGDGEATDVRVEPTALVLPPSG